MNPVRGKGIARYVINGGIEIENMTRHVVGLPQVRESLDGRIKFYELRNTRTFLRVLYLFFFNNPLPSEYARRKFFMGYIIDAFFTDVSQAPNTLRGRTMWLKTKVQEIETLVGRITRNTGVTPQDRDNAIEFFANFHNAVTVYQREQDRIIDAITA